MAVWLQLIWPEFVYLQKSDGIFMENVHNTFGIAAAGAGGGAEQLLQVQSSWERWVKVWAGDPPFHPREIPGFKSFFEKRNRLLSLRHHFSQTPPAAGSRCGERKLIAEVACLPSECLLQKQAFSFWEVANSARQTQLHDRQFTPRLATSWHKSVVLFRYLSFGLLADELRGA